MGIYLRLKRGQVSQIIFQHLRTYEIIPCLGKVWQKFWCRFCMIAGTLEV